MSKERIEIITCPECGTENKITIWDSLNGDIDPDAKKELLNGTLFRFKCDKCGHESNLQYSILYHDMKNNAMVYFVHPDAVEETIRELIDMENKLPVKMDGYRKRVVCDQNTLREKAIIFDNGLDDRVVEIIKLMYWANAQKQCPNNNINAIYFMIIDGKMSLQFFADQPMSADIPDGLYEKISIDFQHKIQEVEDSFVIDLDWAKNTLRK